MQATSDSRNSACASAGRASVRMHRIDWQACTKMLKRRFKLANGAVESLHLSWKSTAKQTFSNIKKNVAILWKRDCSNAGLTVLSSLVGRDGVLNPHAATALLRGPRFPSFPPLPQMRRRSHT